MRIFKIVAAALLVLVCAAIITAVVAGVTLEVRNHSPSTIQDLAIDYERGRIELAGLDSGQTWSKRVGRIGEGANFSITFREGPTTFATRFNMYFHDLSLRKTIVFDIQSDQRIRVWERGQRESHQIKRAERVK